MKRLRVYMILFGVLLSLPLLFVGWRTYGALDREAEAQVRFFAERLFDDMETEMAELVQREERRGVDAYRHTLVQDGHPVVSPLAHGSSDDFILGYFQNNPDGSFQTPLAADATRAPVSVAGQVRQLEAINMIFNQRKAGATGTVNDATKAPIKAEKTPIMAQNTQAAFADRYLNTFDRKKSKSVLGQQKTRVEEITAGQAMQLARSEVPAAAPKTAESIIAGAVRPRPNATIPASERMAEDALESEPSVSAPPAMRRSPAVPAAVKPDDDRFRVEVAPLQAVTIDSGRVFIFRRIGIGGQIYRQGFVLEVQPFLEHLLKVHYDPQPIARYTRLSLQAAGVRAVRSSGSTGATPGTGDRLAARTFPAPFGFVTAEMRAVALPPSPARQTLTLALAILGVVMVAGLVSIYHGARSVLDLSERRSRFVSAVTHELKTPLTNIRMYVEMLEQGIAATPEREQAYLGILASESARLSGLINNVLELSRLEKRTRQFTLTKGDLSDVLTDVQAVMAESLAREGFTLTVKADDLPHFAYDREVLVQVLINLMENSIKFGRHLTDRHITITVRPKDGWVELTVGDTGPGIPRRALMRVFEDFYRVDNNLTRSTGGTGIGLAW
ncbi:sensor histidine kinase [Desulfosarcina cetonica]|uniref:sensor histidine kinase n=1 Tax=Desulfosarcina cetonica TaxID=90730 RepID=UPI0006D165E2|nr:HAMP domain-containing sensor histidine kinase [Desulfosarcina cetonica]